jgi:hypothetical protein
MRSSSLFYFNWGELGNQIKNKFVERFLERFWATFLVRSLGKLGFRDKDCCCIKDVIH